MKKTALFTMMLLGTSLASAQSLRQLKDDISQKLDRVNNNRSIIMNMERGELLQVEASLDDIIRLSRQERREERRGPRHRRGDRRDRRGDRGGYGYGRFEALEALERIENGTNDATSVFSMIERDVESNQVTWESGVDIYRELLALTGGANNTTTAKSHYQTFVQKINEAGMDVQRSLDALKGLNRAENGINDSMQSFQEAINHAIRHNFNPSNSIEAMTILTNALGANETTTIRSTFSDLARNKVIGIVAMTNDLLEVHRLENGIADALGNYMLVVRAVENGARYNRALETMKTLITRHGANNTSTIRNQFRLLYN